MIQNNSPEMKTIVETFLIEETVSLIYDNDQLEKWHKQVEELGLEGQKSIVKPEKSPIPFLHLKSTLRVTLETLCPQKASVESYNITPIPVEILDLIALSKKEQYFDKIQIWYDDKSPDPCCVGAVYNDANARSNGYTWNMQYYLLGKWADVKQSFDELKERAIKRYRAQKIHEIQQNIKRYERELEDIDNTVINTFGVENNDLLPF